MHVDNLASKHKVKIDRTNYYTLDSFSAFLGSQKLIISAVNVLSQKYPT